VTFCEGKANVRGEKTIIRMERSKRYSGNVPLLYLKWTAEARVSRAQLEAKAGDSSQKQALIFSQSGM